MLFVGGVGGEGIFGGFVFLFGENCGEVQVVSFVVWGIGVGQVVGQYFGVLGVEVEGLLVDIECFVEIDVYGCEFVCWCGFCC